LGITNFSIPDPGIEMSVSGLQCVSVKDGETVIVIIMHVACLQSCIKVKSSSCYSTFHVRVVRQTYMSDMI